MESESLSLEERLAAAEARADAEAARKNELAWELMGTRNKFMHTERRFHLLRDDTQEFLTMNMWMAV